MVLLSNEVVTVTATGVIISIFIGQSTRNFCFICHELNTAHEHSPPHLCTRPPGIMKL